MPCVESVVQLVSCARCPGFRVVCQGHVLSDAAGKPFSFRHADYSFKSVRLSISSHGSYPPFAGFLWRRLPASRSLTWSISAPTYSSASCWQLRYMSVSRRWNVAAARACHADHCEVWETTSSSFCVACSSYSTSQLRKVIAWRRPVRLCRSLRSGGGRIIRPGHQHSDPDEGATQRSKTDKTPLIRPNSSCGRRRPVPDISLADVVCAETKSQGFLPSRCRQWPWRTSYKA